tara:strand:- start:407 stop:862 length:456 start_codon:yes stop_codon:yes gene_type:complete
MRKTRIRKKSRSSIRIAKDKLWRTLKELVHKRDGSVCISCGAKNLKGHNRHAGHFIPSAACGGFLRYDLRNVWTQCARCNMFLGGAGAEYTRALEKLYDAKFVDKILIDKQQEIKLDVHYVESLNEYYKTLLDKSPKELMKLTKTYKGFKI